MNPNQKLIEAVRKIAKSDPELSRALDAASAKAPIGARRGIAYFTPDGEIKTKTADPSANGDDAEKGVPEDADTSTDPAKGGGFTGGTSGGGGSGSGGTGDGTNDGMQNGGVGDIADTTQSADALYDGNWSVGDNLSNITGTDCATGQDVNLQTAGEWFAPEGWEDPDKIPVMGYYWYTTVGGNSCGNIYPRTGGVKSASVQEAFQKEVDAMIAWGDSKYTTDWTHSDPRLRKHSETEYSICMSTYGKSITTGQSFGSNTAAVFRRISGEYSPEGWPSDGSTQLLAKDGQILSHPLDPDKPEGYPASQQQVEICKDGKRVRVTARKNGGVITTPVDADGTPTGAPNIVTDENGKIVAAVSGSAVDQYL